MKEERRKMGEGKWEGGLRNRDGDERRRYGRENEEESEELKGGVQTDTHIQSMNSQKGSDII